MCLANSPKRGFAAVLAIVFVGMFAAMALAISMGANVAMARAENYERVQAAKFEAENGLAFYTYHLRQVQVPPSVEGRELLEAVAAELAVQLNGTENLQGQQVLYDGQTIQAPAIATQQNRSFSASISLVDDQTVRLTVQGQVSFSQYPQTTTVKRNVSMDFEPLDSLSKAFEYGMFAKGPIHIGMNLDYTGYNDPSEASMYSAALGTAVEVGSGYIDGDVVTCDPNAVVDVGATVNGQIIRGAGDVDVPRADGSVFEPFATNIVDASTDTSSGTFTNIRIRANTNPQFGNVTLRGVVYVESPNYVYFKNNVDFIGVLVTEDPGPGASPETHKIYFKNNLTMRGVEDLPATPEFAELREMTGSAILAPGFEVQFKNNFDAISGLIACESLVLKNNLDATLFGPIIVYGEGGITFKNNSRIVVDRSKYPGPPPGFAAGPKTLTPIPDTYVEN